MKIGNWLIFCFKFQPIYIYQQYFLFRLKISVQSILKEVVKFDLFKNILLIGGGLGNMFVEVMNYHRWSDMVLVPGSVSFVYTTETIVSEVSGMDCTGVK